MSDKKRKSEYLLYEIGGIDESFLAEAESYRKKRKPVWLKPLVAVACACVFVVGALGVMMGSSLMAKGEVGMESAPENNMSIKGDRDESHGGLKTETVEDESFELYSFELDLLMSSQDGYKGYDTFASIPREQGKTYILWQYINGGKLFISRALEDSEVKNINEYLGIGMPVGQDSPSREFNVWILRGDGSVISPYLIGSGGNIGNALFDYEAEIIPQEQLIELIAKILADKPQT